MQKNQIIAVDYNEATDEFTVEVTTTERKTVDASLFAVLYEAKCQNSLTLSPEQLAYAELYENHFDEVPQDMLNHPIEF